MGMRIASASAALISVLACSPLAQAADLKSGAYEGLLIAVAPSGRLVGRYSERQGEGVVKSCTFNLKGQTRTGGAAQVEAWAEGTSTRLAGRLTAQSDGGVALTLPHARDLPGCGLVLPPLVDTELDLDRTQTGAWTDLVRVTAPKAALEPRPGAHEGHAYVVRGDVLGVLSRRADQLQVAYPSGAHARQGWVDARSVGPVAP